MDRTTRVGFGLAGFVGLSKNLKSQEFVFIDDFLHDDLVFALNDKIKLVGFLLASLELSKLDF